MSQHARLQWVDPCIRAVNTDGRLAAVESIVGYGPGAAEYEAERLWTKGSVPALLGATWDGYHRGSGRPEPGTPYPRAFDLLVQVYEGGYHHALHTLMRADSVRGLAYMRELFERSERPALLWRWVHVDGEWEPVIGGFYLPAPLPPQCDGHHWLDDHDTPWCEAGGYLFGGIVAEAWERTPGGKRRGTGYGPAPVPESLPEHVEDWHRRCR